MLEKKMLEKRMRDVKDRVGALMPKARRKRERRRRTLLFITGSALGAIGTFLFDPSQGRVRRKRMLAGAAQAGSATVARLGRLKKSVDLTKPEQPKADWGVTVQEPSPSR